MIFPRTWLHHFLSGLKSRFRRFSGKDTLIGQVLLDKGIVAAAQLDHALDAQKSRLIEDGQAVPLGMVIVDLGYAEEKTVVDAINEHYQLDVSSLSDNIRELVGRLRRPLVEKLPTPHLPIWLQLSVTMMLMVVLTALALNYFSLNRQKEQLYQRTLTIGLVSLNYFDNNARVPMLKDNLLQLNALLKNASQVEGIVYSFITDNSLRIKAHTNLNRIGDKMPAFSNTEKIQRKGQDVYFNHVLPDGTHVLNISRPILFRDKRLGMVHVGVSLDFIEQMIHQERLTLLVTTLVILFLALLLALTLGFRYSLPIKKLVSATHEIGRGNYRHKVRLQRNDELGNLARAFNRMSDELWRNTMMQESFGKYVGNEVLEMIMADPSQQWLKGNRNEATILFADIRGFTSFSDEKEPEQVVVMLNAYFEITARVIMEHGGYVDKFIGDAVLGVFGVPVYRRKHMERALRAAVDIQERLQKSAQNGNPLLAKVGIGIDSGVIVSGNIGSQEKMEYTVIGGSVNAASRLSDLAGPGEILISRTVYNKVKHMITAEARPARRIKGFAGPVETFKVLGVRNRQPRTAKRIAK
ncbi:MAG: adenylate/guanylate cyclase domain-containing protein [Desulfosudaceae bacterium]